MKVDICIPAYNEEEIIAEAAREVSGTLSALQRGKISLVVVNNASTDATAQQASLVTGVQVLEVPVKGKGAALVAAAKKLKGDMFGFIDADLSAHPEDFEKLFIALERGADIAIGSRLLNEKIVNRGFLRSLSSRTFNFLRKNLLGISVADSQCGLKLMNARGREIMATCEETGWFMDMEFLSRAEKAGLRITEVPIRWDETRFKNRQSKLNLFNDSISAVRAMVRIRNRIT